MKHFASLFLLVAVFHSAQYYDLQKVDNGKMLAVTERVLAGTIAKDVARVQTQTVDGKQSLVFVAYDSNMTSVEKHCSVVQLANNEDATGCAYKPGKMRAYPTISY